MCVYLMDAQTKVPAFSLQWHITAKCDQRCKHCYMYDSPSYKSEIDNELSFDECKSIINDFMLTLKKWSRKGAIFFTGGDPLLRDDFFDILKYANSKGIYPIGIAGNSYHLEIGTALKLKEYGVTMYQISLDGMKKTHDSHRKAGSFDDAVRGYRVLKESGISPMCMFTLSRLNKDDLIDVIRLAAELELAGFDFDRLVRAGSAKGLGDDMIPPLEYRELLLSVNEEYRRLKSLGCKTQFGYKDNLWRLILKDKDLSSDQALVPQGFELKRGCLIGLSGLAVLSDGNVMACRRLSVIIGKLPEQRISEIFKNSAKLAEFRNVEKIDKCGLCENLDMCSGCRAVAYGYSGGNYFSKDPGCWL